MSFHVTRDAKWLKRWSEPTTVEVDAPSSVDLTTMLAPTQNVMTLATTRSWTTTRDASPELLQKIEAIGAAVATDVRQAINTQDMYSRLTAHGLGELGDALRTLCCLEYVAITAEFGHGRVAAIAHARLSQSLLQFAGPDNQELRDDALKRVTAVIHAQQLLTANLSLDDPLGFTATLQATVQALLHDVRTPSVVSRGLLGLHSLDCTLLALDAVTRDHAKMPPARRRWMLESLRRMASDALGLLSITPDGMKLEVVPKRYRADMNAVQADADRRAAKVAKWFDAPSST